MGPLFAWLSSAGSDPGGLLWAFCGWGDALMTEGPFLDSQDTSAAGTPSLDGHLAKEGDDLPKVTQHVPGTTGSRT